MSPYSFLFVLILPINICCAQNVGIGTADPQHKLVVEGDRIHLKNAESNKFLYMRTDGDEIDITTVGSHFWITAAEHKDIILNPNNSSTGNVGIGTHSPKEKLHVDGKLQINALAGEGNRLLFANSKGVISSSNMDLQQLQEENRMLKEEMAALKLRLEKLEALLNSSTIHSDTPIQHH